MTKDEVRQTLNEINAYIVRTDCSQDYIDGTRLPLELKRLLEAHLAQAFPLMLASIHRNASSRLHNHRTGCKDIVDYCVLHKVAAARPATAESVPFFNPFPQPAYV